MVYYYNGKKIFYKFVHGKSTCPILLMHGWGCDGSIFNKLMEFFPNRSFLIVDFPPFGNSDKAIEDWNIFSYVGMIMSLCEHLHIEKCDLLAHSFGGRVALILCAVKRSLVHTCILVDSAGMKPRFNLKRRINVLRYKINKKLGKDTQKYGSKDYLALSDEHKRIFVSVVNTFLEDYCKRIRTKTLIIWGELDDQTPLYMAKRINKLIHASKLKVIKDSGHFCFLDKPLEFYKLVNEFWEEN